MIKERISLSGDLKSKVQQLMIYAGWYEGRKVDISIASQYYAERGVPMMKSTQRFYHKYFRFLYKGIIIKHNKTEPTYTKTSLFLCEKRRFFMARTEKGVVATI